MPQTICAQREFDYSVLVFATSDVWLQRTSSRLLIGQPILHAEWHMFLLSNDPAHCSAVAGQEEKRCLHLTRPCARTTPLSKPLIQHFVVQIPAQELTTQNLNPYGVFEYSSYRKKKCFYAN